MNFRHIIGIYIFTVCSILFVLPYSANAQARRCSAQSLVEQRFPTNPQQPEETRWSLCLEQHSRNGLVIKDAWFRRSPDTQWIQVFYDARVAELFVPYDSGYPRFLDMTNHTSPFSLTRKHCPSTSVQRNILAVNRVNICRETRDRGLAWTNDGDARLGEEMVLWGILDAANYNYIIEWTFRDDGVVQGRVGATAQNLIWKAREGHMHGVHWRLDIDLNGFTGDSVYINSLIPSGSRINNNMQLVNAESDRVWDPLAFTSLHIQDNNLKNKNDKISGYHLMPLRAGTARHPEAFTQKDFWITKYNYSEMYPTSLPNYIIPADPVSNSDIVVWYYNAMHHQPRDEDGFYLNTVFNPLVAHLMWNGFILKPHNLFDRTPLCKLVGGKCQ